MTADIARIELTRRNAALLEEKAAEERAQILALRSAQAVDSPEMPLQGITKPTEERVDPATVSNRELREKFAKEQGKPHKDPHLWGREKVEVEAWTPRGVRRRG